MYVFVVAFSVVKMIYQTLQASFRMLVSGTGMQSPEDLRPGLLNPEPKLSQLSAGDYVDRPRRIMQTDLWLNPAFWVSGLVFVAVNPPLLLAQIVFGVFLLPGPDIGGHTSGQWALATGPCSSIRAF